MDGNMPLMVASLDFYLDEMVPLDFKDSQT